MYAVIATGGKQYRVTEEDTIRVEKLDAEVGDEIVFDRVLMIGGGDETLIGNPHVDGAKVLATVTSTGKSDKIIVYKYKRKSGYHKKNGHRQAFTEVKIDAVTK